MAGVCVCVGGWGGGVYYEPQTVLPNTEMSCRLWKMDGTNPKGGSGQTESRAADVPEKPAAMS